MKNRRTNLDEHQELELLRIEHNGFWMAFYGLLIAMVLQLIIYGDLDGAKQVAGEWVVFMVIAGYVSFSCMRKGIWDRKLKADPKVNLGLSAITAVICGIISFAIKIRQYPDTPYGCIATGVFFAVMIFVLVFAALEISRKTYEKKVADMEKEPEEEEE